MIYRDGTVFATPPGPEEEMIKCMCCECEHYRQKDFPLFKVCECDHLAYHHRVLNPPEASRA